MSSEFSPSPHALDLPLDRRVPLDADNIMLLGLSPDIEDVALATDRSDVMGLCPFLLAAFFYRLQHAGVIPTVKCVIGVMLCAQEGERQSIRPGTLVLWAYTIKCLAERLGKGEVSWKDVDEHFQGAFPSMAAWEELWRAQKIPAEILGDSWASDNWLDKPVAWAPIAAAAR